MNFLILSILFFLFLAFVICVVAWVRTPRWVDDSYWSLSISFLLLTIAMLLITFWFPLGTALQKTVPAFNTRVENKFIITTHTESFPTLIETDIKFFNSDVNVQRTIPRNAWGIKMESIKTYKTIIINEDGTKE